MKKVMKNIYIKIVSLVCIGAFFVMGIFAPYSALAQTKNDNLDYPQPLWKSEPFSEFNPKDEIVERRTQFGKHFRVSDSSSMAILTAGGSLNYKDGNGKWQTIDTRIIKNNSGRNSQYEYVSAENRFTSFYSAHVNNGTLTKIDDYEFTDGLNKQMVWLDENYNVVASVNIKSQKQIIIEQNTITYKEILPGIDLRYTQGSDGRHMDYIIANSKFLDDMPKNAKYLAFVEDINLSENWSARYSGAHKEKMEKEEMQQVFVFNEKDKMLLNYKEPFYYEMNNEQEGDAGIYRFTQAGKNLNISTVVPTDWLADNSRSFPVVIDPTYTIATTNDTYSTQYHLEKIHI